MLKKEANIIVGGLSKAGKMPCPSINLPAAACITGQILAKVPGTTCHGCYALKGRYKFKNTKIAMARRLRALAHGSWTTAMVTLMQNRPHFRWHDSGDLQGAQHLKNILEVARQTPDTKHWLPTREAKLLQYMDPDIIPKNLIIRLSATKVNGAASKSWPWTSTVTDRKDKTCPAPDQGGKCKSCRNCWDKSVKNVIYAKH
jgi:hypothetical protein